MPYTPNNTICWSPTRFIKECNKLAAQLAEKTAEAKAAHQLNRDILEAKKTHLCETKGGDFKAHVVYDTGSWLIGYVDSEAGFTTLHWDYNGVVMAADSRFDLAELPATKEEV